jgi:hypothetical protein
MKRTSKAASQALETCLERRMRSGSSLSRRMAEQAPASSDRPTPSDPPPSGVQSPLIVRRLPALNSRQRLAQPCRPADRREYRGCRPRTPAGRPAESGSDRERFPAFRPFPASLVAFSRISFGSPWPAHAPGRRPATELRSAMPRPPSFMDCGLHHHLLRLGRTLQEGKIRLGADFEEGGGHASIPCMYQFCCSSRPYRPSR